MTKSVAISSLFFLLTLISQKSVAINLCSDPWPPYIQGTINQKSINGPIILLEKLLFSRLGIEDINFNLINWSRCLKLVENGEEDGVIMLFKKKERMSYIAYTDPITTTKLLVYYSSNYFPNGFHWHSIDDLVDLNIGVVRGNSYGEAFDSAIKTGKITPHESKDEISNLLLLTKGRIDITIINSVIASNLIRKNTLLDKITKHPNIFLEQKQYIGISKQSPFVKRIPEINVILDEMHKNNTIKNMLSTINQ
jgi:polar amino acid transport system substrate-binding protein